MQIESGIIEVSNLKFIKLLCNLLLNEFSIRTNGSSLKSRNHRTNVLVESFFIEIK